MPNEDRDYSVLLSSLTGVAVGGLYGVVSRYLFHHLSHAGGTASFGIMTFSFLFLVPFALGYVTVYWANAARQRNWVFCFFMPWLSTALAVAMSWIVRWEGAICIVMISPLCLIISSLGGWLFYVQKGKASQKGTMLSLLVLPYLACPLESRLPLSQEIRDAQNVIEIQAPAEEVWKHIRSVRKIAPSEHSFSWSHFIGFPRPVEASLSGSGVGGVRHATFEGGVVFTETITRWKEARELAFNIKANTETIPPNTFDEHVTIGGPFFDVLEGHYTIERLDPHRVRLHLSSRHRLSTRFNSYSGAWTDFIMRDIQSYILSIIKRRCERNEDLAHG